MRHVDLKIVVEVESVVKVDSSRMVNKDLVSVSAASELEAPVGAQAVKRLKYQVHFANLRSEIPLINAVLTLYP